MRVVVFVSHAICIASGSLTYDQFLPPTMDLEFYNGFSGHEEFIERITIEKQFTWEGEPVKVNTGHWRC